MSRLDNGDRTPDIAKGPNAGQSIPVDSRAVHAPPFFSRCLFTNIDVPNQIRK